jgi:hypothetical protein
MSEIAWFGVLLGLLVLVLALQAFGSYLWYRIAHRDEAEKRERAAAMGRHPSGKTRTPKAA